MAQNGGLFKEEKAMDAYNALVFSTKSTHESVLRNAKQKNEGVL
jgi:hypothetical protein